jgi:glycosyltransferase involved in cell wall biosynthesis
MKICHVGIMGDIRKEGMITQYIYDNCEGEHIYHSYREDYKTIHYYKIPKADIYILHCMKNLLYLENFITFNHPHLGSKKIISLVHSSEPCMPSKHSDKVVVLTNYWKDRMKNLYDIDSTVISGGIDLNLYQPRKESNKITFGKISRPEPGKFHKNWNDIIYNALENNPKTECRIICNGYKKLNYLKHKRMKWIEGINIKEHKKKIEELSKLSIYIECHRDSGSAFVDTFNMSMLESMALGIPVIMYKGLQHPMAEVLKHKYSIYDTIEGFEDNLDWLIYSKKTRKIYGEEARARAEDFSHKKMIEKWNEILC